jgi:hypothetical protein
MANLSVAVLVGLFVVVSGHAATTPCSSPPVPSLSTRELSQNGAVVRSGGSTGVGFVVGWRQGEAWVAVPAHIVFGEGVTPTNMVSYRAGLDVRLFGDTAPRRLCDKGPSPPQGYADLSFLCVEWEGRPFFNEGVLARRVKVDDEITLVDFAKGQQHRGSVVKAPGIDKVVRARGDIEAKGLAGVRGQSGSLTASAGGVVGLYLGSYTGFSILSMSAIRAIAELVDVPWQLTYSEYYDCTAIRKVCLTAETEIAPASISMRSIFASGSYSLSRDACATLPEGRYEIVMPSLGLTCEPKSIAVYAAAADLQLALRCSVALMGTWRTEDGDELLCAEIQMGSAQCSGLGKQGYGMFTGSINARNQGFSILGSFFDPAGNSREANGSLHWSGGFLVGEIRRQLEPPRQLKLKHLEEK